MQIRSRRTRLAGLLAVCATCATAAVLLRETPRDERAQATARRGALAVRLIESGTLRAAESMTYRSPVDGRETEIAFLAPEGARVNEGDLLVRLDTTALQADLERAGQALRQAELDAKLAAAQAEDATAAVQAVTDGEGVLGLEESRNGLDLAERKAARLREEHAALEPLLNRGFITREELSRTSFALEQAEADLRLARKRHEILVNRSHPRDEQKARLQAAEREAQHLNASERLADARVRVAGFQALIAACAVYARRPGLVVYEENFTTAPRRKVRVGDRVTPSQGLVTIPDLSRMLVDSSVREADVHGVHPGQTAAIELDAFPGRRLTAQVLSVGTLAQASIGRAFEEKRFGVTLALDSHDADLRPEMTARVELLVEQKSSVLLVPINAVRDQGGAVVVSVVRPWGVESRSVELGASNDVDVEVTRGLAAGEQVLLVGQTPPGADVGPQAGAAAVRRR
jgi:HlyD family secretion protein